MCVLCFGVVVCCAVSLCVVCVRGVRGVCVGVCVARLGTRKIPCEGSKRIRVYRQHAHMLKHMCACCLYIRKRFERTHGGVFEPPHAGPICLSPLVSLSPFLSLFLSSFLSNFVLFLRSLSLLSSRSCRLSLLSQQQ